MPRYHREVRYCRWCGNTYITYKRTDRDGFCNDNNGKCKQAHYRAFKKYNESVTAKARTLKLPGKTSNAEK